MTHYSQTPSTVSVFNFQSNNIRVAADTVGEPWFLANDVCGVLGYRNSRDAIAKHCRQGGVAKRDTPTESGNQEMTYINEGNLYRLIIKSRKPEAEPFESWVCDEVLPSLRKTGSYTVPQPAISNTLTPAQQRHIQHTVAALTKLHGRSFQAVYGSIKDQFHVGTYKDIPAEQYPALCKFLNIEPLTGEYIPRRPDPAISETDLVNLNAITVHALAVSQEWKEVILPLLEAAGSRHIGRMYDHFVSLGFVAKLFRSKYKSEFAALHADEMARRGMEKAPGSRAYLG